MLRQQRYQHIRSSVLSCVCVVLTIRRFTCMQGTGMDELSATVVDEIRERLFMLGRAFTQVTRVPCAPTAVALQ
jgi:hypothetical protein